ncbi:MAG: hypothetical protein ACI3Y0_13825 [Prevotella sp.]
MTTLILNISDQSILQALLNTLRQFKGVVIDEESTYDSYSDVIPQDLLMEAAEFAIKEYREGKCIPHSQVIEEINYHCYRSYKSVTIYDKKND